MKAITVKEFDSLEQRDFENGAVRDSIRAALKGRPQVTLGKVKETWRLYSGESLSHRRMTEIGFRQAIQQLGLKIVE